MSALKCFDLLPVAGIIAGKIFAVHGGLSPHMDSLEVCCVNVLLHLNPSLRYQQLSARQYTFLPHTILQI